MPKIITITGKDMIDEGLRVEALEALQKEATTEELTKLSKVMKNPQYRAMFKIM